MSLILNLETAGAFCSVCLAENGLALASRESLTINSHASLLTVLIAQVLDDAGKTANDLEAVALADGPGSYTGLRIGASTAKGLCYALCIPLIKVPSLKILAKVGLSELSMDQEKIMPVIQAKKDAFYYAVFDRELNRVKIDTAYIIDDDQDKLNALFENIQAVFFATPQVVKDKLRNFGIKIDEVDISAKHMATMSYMAWQSGIVENAISYEPFYLSGFGKEF